MYGKSEQENDFGDPLDWEVTWGIETSVMLV